MKRKRMWGILLSVVMTMTLLSGCGKSNSGSSSTTSGANSLQKAASESPAKKGDKIITWMFWDDLKATTDLMSKQYAEVIKRFNAEDNGYHCNVITTNLEEYDTKLNALIAAGQAPDVWICNPGPNMSQYVDAGVVMDLTDTLNKDKEWKDSFTDGIFSNLTYNKKVMGIPTNFAAACVFYNKDIFKKAGVQIPKTWDEFIEVCKKIKKAGYAPISVSAGTSWCLSMIAGYLCDREGGPDNLEGLNNGTAKWTDKSFVDAATKLKDLAPYFQSTYAGDSNDQATANFYKGNAAMLVQGSWAIAQINGNNAKMQDKCGVFQFPGITGAADPNRWIVKTDNLLVSKNTKNKDACIALLKEFTNVKSQKATAEIAGKMPVCKVDIDYKKAPKQLKCVQDAMKNLSGTLDFYNESLPTVEAGKEFDNTMVSIVMGDSSVKDGLTSLQKFFDDNIKKK